MNSSPKAGGRGARRRVGRLVAATLVLCGATANALAPWVPIPLGHTWSYFVATQPPSDPPAAWRLTAFDDSAWTRAVSGFGYSPEGYNEVTPIPAAAAPWVTLCLRTHFTVDDPAQVAWLVLRADYDDGLAVFLNGTEVARRALPADDATVLDTPALTAGRKWGEEIPLALAPGLLQPGDNVLAVEVHKSGPLDTVVAFVPELLANFTRGPLVANLSSNRVEIVWRTPVPATSEVTYAPEGAEVFTQVDPQTNTVHSVTLTNLPPGTAVRYVAASATETERVVAPAFTFRTPRASGPVHFSAIGDSGSGNLVQRTIAQQLRDPGDFLMHLGDVVYPSFQTNLTDLRCLSLYRETLARFPCFATFGNHDLYVGDGAYLAGLVLPTNTVSGTEHFYSFDQGDVHFVSLFLPLRGQMYETNFLAYRMAEGSPQYTWLTNDLAQTDKPWKIVFGHCPIFTSGPHRFDIFEGVYDHQAWQNLLLPVLARYGVQLYLAAHDHGYERLGPIDGVHFVVSAGGGGGLYWLAERDAASDQHYLLHHHVRVDVEGDVLRLRAIDPGGRAFDEFTLRRRVAAPEALLSAWHTPVPTPTLAPDGDGNFLWQVLDVPGPVLQGVAGRRANPGRLQVSCDREFVHLGLSQIMLPDSQNLVLFVDSPRLTGVDSLQGLGNGLVDPQGEGVELLDALEAVSFQDFRPAIACVLGDEYADGTFRSFPRVVAPWDPGQGVFRLDAGFSSVPGVLVQQFNRSPQEQPALGEQHADWVRISIPRAELGAPQAAEILRFGALVVAGGADLVSTQWIAAIDPAFLGSAFTWTSPTDPVVLGGLPVRLAVDPDPDSDGLDTALEMELGTNPESADTDGDGLPDGWEHATGLDPRSAAGTDGAGGDPDRDGMSNSAEWLAGTLPRDENSLLRVIRTEPTPLGLRLIWNAVPGRSYQVQAADRPEGSAFADVELPGFPRVATATAEQALVPLPEPAGLSRYLRIRLLAP